MGSRETSLVRHVGMRVPQGSWTPLLALVVLAGWTCALGSGCEDQGPSLPSKPKPLPFLWGTATAGFQVDMGCPGGDCNDTGSDWWVWTHDSENITEGMTSGDLPEQGPGHWELFPSDLDLARGTLKTNAYRFSFEWSRIFPRSTENATTAEEVRTLADPDAVAQYHRLLQAVRDNDMVPLVTLHHYTLPLWLHDPFAYAEGQNGQPVEHQPAYERSGRYGWLEEEAAAAGFAKYARFCATEFGEEVDLWLTLNEPMAVVTTGFLLFQAGLFGRTNPPGIFDVEQAVKAQFAMVEAHISAYDALKAGDTWDADGDGEPCRVGFVNNLTPFEPDDPGRPADVTSASNADYFYNRVMLNAVVYGDYDRDLDRTAEERHPDRTGKIDFMGLNYYTRTKIRSLGFPFNPGYPLMDYYPSEVWQYAPEGIAEMVDLIETYGLPTIVTENGYGFPNSGPSAETCIVDHLHSLLAARNAGKKVLGYCYWSLLDNLEWNEGYKIQMGLFRWDPVTKEREMKPWADVYRQIIEANAVPDDLWERWGTKGGG